MSAAPLPVANSYAALSPDSPAGRVPRAKGRVRPAAFAAAFDAKTLFYDCFRHADGRRILLVGPPPYGIDFRGAAFTAGGETLRARYHASLSTMVTELLDAPADAATVRVTIAGETHELAVQPNSCAALAGRRLLFTVKRDNELGWIREWAEYHQRAHGTDAVIVVDNGSSRYDAAELRATLAAVPGIALAAVPSWPYSFGPIDPAVTGNPYWARFLQIGSMSVVLRRYGEAAFGLLDCDIDELVHTPQGTTIFDLAAQSPKGLVVMEGRFVEAVTAVENPVHADFTMRLKDKKARRSSPRKWVLDPNRDWVRELDVHPYMHWIHGRPAFAKTQRPDIFYWHFRGISTNWKDRRTETGHLDEAMLEVDRDWAESSGRLR